MSWGKVDDGHYDHPKVLALPRAIRNACDGLYWRAISRCNRTLSDGYLTAGDLELVDAEDHLVDALVEVGLFDRDRRGRIRVHDFLDHSKSRAEVLGDREKRAAAGRAGGLASARARAKQARDGKRTQREANRSNPVQPPSRPVPSDSESSPPDGGADRAGDVLSMAQVVEDLIGRPFSFGAGSRVLETLRADVREMGARRVYEELRSFRAAHPGPMDAAGLIFGAHKALYPIPDAPRNGATRKPKGYQPDMEAVRDVVDR